MSVTSVKEIHPGRDGGDSFDLQKGAASNMTRKFRVTTSSAYDGADTVLQSCDNLCVAHPSAGWLFVKSRKAANESFSKQVWIVTLKYDVFKNDPTSSPLRQPAVTTWQTESSQEMATRDMDGEAILNTAGDYYETGVPVNVANWTVKVRKNIPYIPYWIGDYRNAINSAAFRIDGYTVPAYAAKVTGISIGSWQVQNEIWYRPLDLTIQIRDTWRKHIMNMGLYRKVDGKRIKCVDDEGVAATKPMHLKTDGTQLTDPTPATVVFNEHSVYPELPFSVLPLV